VRAGSKKTTVGGARRTGRFLDEKKRKGLCWWTNNYIGGKSKHGKRGDATWGGRAARPRTDGEDARMKEGKG